jgi:hypothetical protein
MDWALHGLKALPPKNGTEYVELSIIKGNQIRTAVMTRDEFRSQKACFRKILEQTKIAFTTFGPEHDRWVEDNWEDAASQYLRQATERN